MVKTSKKTMAALAELADRMVASGNGPEIAKFMVFALPRSWQTAIRGKLFKKLYVEICV